MPLYLFDKRINDFDYCLFGNPKRKLIESVNNVELSRIKQFSKTLIILFTSILFASLVYSCKYKKYSYDNLHKLRRADKITKLRATAVNKFELYFPSTSSIINGYYVLVDSKADKQIQIIDRNSNELIKSFGRLGQGPDEFIGVRQIISDPNNKGYFWIYDISTRNLKYYDLKKVLKNDFSPDKIIRISSDKSGVPVQLVLCQDYTMLGAGLFFKGRISVYDMGGELVRIIGRIPVILKNEELSAQHSQGFIGNIAYKEAKREIYLATRHGTIIEKYDFGGALISTLHGPETYFPEYDIVPAGQYFTMTYNKKTRFGYIDICYNRKSDKLFVLYSGRYHFGKEDSGPGYMGNIIYVLDNRDMIIEQIELDRDIFQMTISDDGSEIYGLSDKEILKYDYIDK